MRRTLIALALACLNGGCNFLVVGSFGVSESDMAALAQVPTFEEETAAFETLAAIAFGTDKTCGTTTPVPSDLPVTPDTTSTADATWTCLGTAPRAPFRYQTTYVVGGPFKSVARGGPDLGPRGVEACIEGDSTRAPGTTLVCIVGATKEDGSRVMSVRPFVAAEMDLSGLDRPLDASGCNAVTRWAHCKSLGLESPEACSMLAELPKLPITRACFAGCSSDAAECARACAPECG